MNLTLNNKVAMVTGGGSGIGRAAALAVVWWSSDAASFVAAQAIAVDGGYVAQ